MDSKAPERARLGWPYRTLGLLDLQLELGLEKASQTGFDARARPLAVDPEEEVITVPGEVVTAPFQFLIQVV